METRTPAEVFPAGELLADELDKRGWTQAEFAEILGRPTQFVSEVISGKKEITRESAAQIGAALSMSPKHWLNLQDSYFLWRQSQSAASRNNLNAVKTRAQLQELAPLALLKKRGFVRAKDLDGQVREVLDLLEMDSFEDKSAVKFAARRRNGGESVTGLQRAWVACVKATASSLEVGPFDREALRSLAVELPGIVRDPECFSDFQRLFAAVGVKLIFVEAFPGGKLDGCAMMVGEHPVIGISGRGKRLDVVLFAILHEVAHILLGHLDDSGAAIIDDLSEDEEPGRELDANKYAGELAIKGTIPQVPARINAAWVRDQAERLNIHPIVLVGRLQNEGIIPWKTTLVRNAPSVTDQIGQWGAPHTV
ncbi:transcriptional regulator [Brachybacterium sp. UNK5269]|uniref:transcriptional regulator n=1 Tax=Brachybacterium sp. UNK5269 TaxID=3408576 RepID=UPI003BAF5846